MKFAVVKIEDNKSISQIVDSFEEFVSELKTEYKN